MSAFSDVYDRLNPAQKQAVDTIEGPLLVIAGPGTGKTQLLSARVANILRRTDTPPANILCLTFTESGAANMRERLTRLIGAQAYDVTISTYHAFGSDLISRYNEYFAELKLLNPIDELSKRQIILNILEALPFKDPLKQMLHHPGDLISTISEVKRALLSSDDLRAISAQNLSFIAKANRAIQTSFNSFTRMPGTYAKAAPFFEDCLIGLSGLIGETPLGNYQTLAAICSGELKTALEEAASLGKSQPLTAWKNRWLEKNADNQFLLCGELENRRLDSLATALDSYQAALQLDGSYDFDDMILKSIEALEQYPALRYSLQERYLYVLLDEFQDTNAAQLRLIQLLTDNPVHEGRPNVLAVGDDDQAIYAFQGAQYSNMLEFYRMYRDTGVIPLTENYRSHSEILKTARKVAGQIESTLISHFDGLSKDLDAANTSLPAANIERREFQSDVAERAWVAGGIKQLLDSGVPAREIAVLAPKHRYLEPLVPFLNDLAVPVRYEKRENILEAPVVRQLLTMSRLVAALAEQDDATASALWPQVLSYDFWQLPVSAIWQLSWQAKADKVGWSQLLIDHNTPGLRDAGLLLLACAGRIATDSCETILDYLIGSTALTTGEAGATVTSPLRSFYTSAAAMQRDPQLFYGTLSHLAVLRSRLREFQTKTDSGLMLPDMLRLVRMYADAGQPMIDTSPYAQAAEAVDLMTVFKAKGLEYGHVFLLSCQDDVWAKAHGATATNLHSRPISIPSATLAPLMTSGYGYYSSPSRAPAAVCI